MDFTAGALVSICVMMVFIALAISFWFSGLLSLLSIRF